MNPKDENEGVIKVFSHNSEFSKCADILTEAINSDPELEARLLEGFSQILIYGVAIPTDEQRAGAIDLASKSDG